MTEAVMTALRRFGLPQGLPRLDRVWLTIFAVLGLVAVFDPAGVDDRVVFASGALLNTLPFVLFACLLIGALAASGAQGVIAKAFEGRETRMIFLAALFGGLAPFCSCEVIPLVAALLAAGAPLSAVMAFWLASPVIDPPTVLITAAALGWPFAIGKTMAAVGIGLAGGFMVQAMTKAGGFGEPLRPRAGCGSCCRAGSPMDVWRPSGASGGTPSVARRSGGKPGRTSCS